MTKGGTMSDPYIEFEAGESTTRAVSIHPENICTIEEGVELVDEGFFGLQNEYETTQDWCRIRTTDGERHQINEPWGVIMRKIEPYVNDYIKLDAYKSSKLDPAKREMLFHLDNVTSIKKCTKPTATNILGIPTECEKDNQRVKIAVVGGNTYIAEMFYDSVMRRIPPGRRPINSTERVD